MKKSMQSVLTVLILIATPYSAAQAERYQLTITNLTRGQIFSPPFVFTHDHSVKLFTSGEPASPELAALAQDADISGLDATLSDSPAVHEIVTGNAPIAPGDHMTLIIHTRGFKRYLSLASMLVTTNDAFLTLNAVKLPFIRKVVTVPAYDAGAEANDEDCTYIPGPPCGNAFSTSNDPGEGYVHIHAGIHGIGDLSAADFDWRNPVARIEIRRVKHLF